MKTQGKIKSLHQSPALRDISTSRPCGPMRISWANVATAVQTIGEISTPPTGFITFRVAASSGSVGTARNIHGDLRKSVFGYQVSTIRITIIRVKVFNTGPAANMPNRSSASFVGSPAIADVITRLAGARATAARGDVRRNCADVRRPEKEVQRNESAADTDVKQRCIADIDQQNALKGLED
jgi:hypothetical protein